MKAFDTPVLLDLLRGAPSARRFVRSLGNEEIATTELNLWELGVLAIQDKTPGRERRLAALGRLRRKLLVLPIEARSVEAALRLTPTASRSALIRGTLEAHGCTEWVTVREVASPTGRGPLRIVEYNRKGANRAK